jgi:hypothetical protein
VLSFLEEDALVRRNENGEVLEVPWQNLLRRWARDYSVVGSNAALQCLAPRGIPSVLRRLPTLALRYAVTSGFAMPREAQVAPSSVLACYVEDVDGASMALDVRAADAGANVLLLSAFDDVVYERTLEISGVVAVAPTQCVVDLLTGPGRDPAQADALLRWMEDHEDVWRRA